MWLPALRLFLPAAHRSAVEPVPVHQCKAVHNAIGMARSTRYAPTRIVAGVGNKTVVVLAAKPVAVNLRPTGSSVVAPAVPPPVRLLHSQHRHHPVLPAVSALRAPASGRLPVDAAVMRRVSGIAANHIADGPVTFPAVWNR